MKFIENGITRKVFLIGKYAIKVPQTDYGWKYFLKGLLANMSECASSKYNKYEICPVLFSSWGGWFLVMPRLKLPSEEEFKESGITKQYCDRLNVEFKSNSFGWMDGRLVAIDYGEFYKTPAI